MTPGVPGSRKIGARNPPRSKMNRGGLRVFNISRTPL
nr:MAG TPA: hypothetical protein [Caudoviricetes sp.]